MLNGVKRLWYAGNVTIRFTIEFRMTKQQWKAGYLERGKSGLGRGLSRPAVETRQGGSLLLYYMAVTGYRGAYIAALIGGNTFKWKFIERDEELISMLIELESDFWHHVESMTPPPLDGSDASARFLSERFPNSTPKCHIILPDTAAGLLTQYDEACEQLAAITERKQLAENLLKEMMGENEVGTAGDRIITWKSVSQERLDSRTLKAEHPTLFKKYANTTSYRRFVVKAAS